MDHSLAENNRPQPSIGLALLAVILTAMAGGLGWGIRGQYGHETGAMIAGVLVGFTLILCYLPHSSSLRAARAVALITAGVSFGGSMTYGQTIGLTKDGPLIGNWDALRWGLLGLFIKGGIWIGFAGALFGMGLGARRYRPLEMALLLSTLFVLIIIGSWALNGPFDPAKKVLPTIYFSDDWHWEPEGGFEPRRECWGGLLFALIGLTAYVTFVRKDRLASNMAFVGFVAGGLGFSGGQCVQAFHAWNPELFTEGLLGKYEPYLKWSYTNWWNMMEITFGAIFGGLLAAGLWLNRHLIVHEDLPDEGEPELAPGWEFVLCFNHLFLLIASSFGEVRVLILYMLFGLVMSVLPLIGIVGGRYWPYLMSLPMVAVTIAGKTLLEKSYKSELMPPLQGWIYLVVIPLTLCLLLALWFAWRGRAGQTSRRFARIGLLFTTWLYFGLNFAFFEFPWPWDEWGGRTHSGVIMSVCAIALTLGALLLGRRFPGRDLHR